MTRACFVLVFALCVHASPKANAAELKVAVASNFLNTMHQLVRQYHLESSDIIKIISGSSGKHYAQIRHGAPYDLFFSANQAWPELLEQQAVAVAESRFTYARGQLVMWSPSLQDIDTETLNINKIARLAIANPKLAPYGRAAQEFLTAVGQWQNWQQRLVRGENINQTLQFVVTGNVELGLIAASQLPQLTGGTSWLVPADLYAPINQQAVILRDSVAVRDFLAFVRSTEAIAIIKHNGYKTP